MGGALEPQRSHAADAQSAPPLGRASTPPPKAGAAQIQQQLKTLSSYDEQRQVVSPSVGGASTPGPADESLRASVVDRVEVWATDAQVAISAVHDRSRGAVDRFVTFVDDKGSGQLKKVGGIAGSLLGLFGTAGKVCGFVVNLLAQAVGNAISDASSDLAKFTRAIDDEQDGALGGVRTLRSTWMAKAAPGAQADAVRVVQAEVVRKAAPVVPAENEIYRDLLFNVAISNDMGISGSDWNERNMSVWGEGPYYHSFDWSIPFKLDGQDVAKELNSLTKADPKVKKPFRSGR